MIETKIIEFEKKKEIEDKILNSKWDKRVRYMTYVAVILFSFGVGRIVGNLDVPLPSYINDRKIEQGYVLPSKLEIKLEDLNKDENFETILRYDGINYLLTLDNKNKPQLKSYEIKPQELVIK